MVVPVIRLMKKTFALILSMRAPQVFLTYIEEVSFQPNLEEWVGFWHPFIITNLFMSRKASNFLYKQLITLYIVNLAAGI